MKARKYEDKGVMETNLGEIKDKKYKGGYEVVVYEKNYWKEERISSIGEVIEGGLSWKDALKLANSLPLKEWWNKDNVEDIAIIVSDQSEFPKDGETMRWIKVYSPCF